MRPGHGIGRWVNAPRCLGLRRLGGGDSLQEAKQLDREREHERGVPLGGNLDDRLQQPQLQRRRVFGHHLGGLRELLGGLELAVGGDDASAAFTFGLGLARHRTLHGVGQGDVLDLDAVDVHAPAAAGLSIISSMPWLSFSRSPSRSSRSLLPMMDRSDVCATCPIAAK